MSPSQHVHDTPHAPMFAPAARFFCLFCVSVFLFVFCCARALFMRGELVRILHRFPEKAASVLAPHERRSLPGSWVVTVARFACSFPTVAPATPAATAAPGLATVARFACPFPTVATATPAATAAPGLFCGSSSRAVSSKSFMRCTRPCRTLLIFFFGSAAGVVCESADGEMAAPLIYAFKLPDLGVQALLPDLDTRPACSSSLVHCLC